MKNYCLCGRRSRGGHADSVMGTGKGLSGFVGNHLKPDDIFDDLQNKFLFFQRHITKLCQNLRSYRINRFGWFHGCIEKIGEPDIQ